MTRQAAIVVAGLALSAAGLYAQANRVGLIRIDGAIGPATASYISRAIDYASAQNLRCLVIQLHTPGGLLESTEVIVQKFFASKVPVVVYVAPDGATAGSAGVFITLAADVAAMAPTTSIGAAHPVTVGGSPGEAAKPDDTMKQKLEQYATSYIEAIAAKRHRNVEWARQSVRESAAITADKALELHVIDIIAADLPDLLRRLDGRQVNGRALSTANAEVMDIPMTAGERVFQLLWRPEVMFLLMLIAMYGIIGELSNPGAILPGVAGAIALILALYMAAILPVNIAGVALIVLALALFVADIFTPTHGVLTAGGIIAFFLGSLMLFDRAEPAFRLSLGLIIPATLVTAAFFAFVVGAGLRAQRLPVAVGTVTLLGKTTAAVSRIDGRDGKVFVDGEYWNAVCETPIEPGELVEIVGVDGLTLTVQRKNR
ncbi:MAG: nodulation protein NfeD [Acidobacteria bacterium]|nr:nodulation protein NfeD [Acidobacteriota bacterium]